MQIQHKIKRSKKRSVLPSRLEVISLSIFLLIVGFCLVPMYFPDVIWKLETTERPIGNIERGAYIAAAAGCGTCHTSPGKQPFAGGYRIKLPFGDILASNITPDAEFGIGNWSFEDFKRAMKLGLSPDSRHYFAAFPYPSYKDMTDADLSDLFSYLMSLKPSKKQVSENQLRAPFSVRETVGLWKMMYLQEPRNITDRGEYLTESLGHCAVCHSQKNAVGGPIEDHHLSGTSPKSSLNPGVPNITPHIEGLAAWSKGDFIKYLSTGERPDGAFSGGKMALIINQVTSQLTLKDRTEMARYLMKLQALETPKD